MKVAYIQFCLKNLVFVTSFSISIAMDISPQKSDEVEHISVKKKSDLDSKGHMSTPFLKRLLKQAYQKKILLHNAFKNPETLYDALRSKDLVKKGDLLESLKNFANTMDNLKNTLEKLISA